MHRVIHIELPAQTPTRAVQFYTEVFGWKFQKWDGPQEYWLITTGEEGAPGINGGLMRENPEFPARTPIPIVGVPSVDEFVAKIEKSGGSITMPKMPVPGVGYLAYAKDTEGVLFGIMQYEPNAQ